MKNERITRAFDSIEPDENAKRRILDKAQSRVAVKNRRNPHTANVAVLAAVCLTLIVGTAVILKSGVLNNRAYTDGQNFGENSGENFWQESGAEQGERAAFSGTVLYSNNGYFIVSIEEGYHSKGALVSFSMEGDPGVSHIGDRAEVEFDGMFMESYPMQIGGDYTVKFTQTDGPTLQDINLEVDAVPYVVDAITKYWFSDPSPKRLDYNSYFFDAAEDIRFFTEDYGFKIDGFEASVAVNPNGWLQLGVYNMYFIGSENAVGFIKDMRLGNANMRPASIEINLPGEGVAGDYTFKYYVDAELINTVKETFGYTKITDWQFINTGKHSYTIKIRNETSGVEAVYCEYEVDFTENPPKMTEIVRNDQVIYEIASADVRYTDEDTGIQITPGIAAWFPMNVWIDINKDSVFYNDFEVPVYGFDKELDAKRLEFDMFMSLKSYFGDCDGYEVRVFANDPTGETPLDMHSQIFGPETADKDGVIRVPELKAGNYDGYRLVAGLIKDGVTVRKFSADFVIAVEIDGSVTIDMPAYIDSNGYEEFSSSLWEYWNFGSTGNKKVKQPY